jgi:hypothetical protein
MPVALQACDLGFRRGVPQISLFPFLTKKHASQLCALSAVVHLFLCGDSAEPPISLATTRKWDGFTKLICDAYFDKRVASYPLDRLQLELAASGRLERPDIVAEWSRLVFETLGHVAPQFPKR